MSRPYTGKVIKHRKEILQKNGDTYIYDQEFQYDPLLKKTLRISNKLVAKIPKGSDKEVPTRPKRKPGEKTASKTEVVATREHTDLCDILAHVGEASGIDQAIRASTDESTALKLMSLARFLVATGGDTLPHVETWQLTHPMPYAEGISEDIYYNLCKEIGTDESFRQRLFLECCNSLGPHPLLAFDSTTESTYSECQIEARYGYNKAGDGLKTIKLLTLYSVDNRQPVAFAKQPGNLSDVSSLVSTMAQMEALGLQGAEIVTDNGYYAEENLLAMCLAGFHFITLAKPSLSWIKKEIEAHREEFVDIDNRRSELGGTYCYSVPLMHAFKRTRKYASQKKGLKKGDIEDIPKRLYLHLYFNPSKKDKEDASLFDNVAEVKHLIESGVELGELSNEALRIAEKYLLIARKRGSGGLSVAYNKRKLDEACKLHGFFALVANHEKDRFVALEKYRKRERVEEYFKLAKNDADAARPRVWYADHLMGRMILQFIALAYEDYLRYEIGKMKAILGKETGDVAHDTPERLKLERDLKKWLDKTSFSNILRWFDAYETTAVSTSIRNWRWNSATTKRDRLFLKMLGLKL